MLASTLRSQLPRALALCGLVDLSHCVNGQVPMPVAQDVEPEPPCWLLFRNMEMACVLKDGCSKRGCDLKRMAQCKACKRAGYCSIDCHKRLVSSNPLLSPYAALMVPHTAIGMSTRRFAN